jgi:hypothetical protein
MGKLDGHCLCGNVTYTVDEGTEPMVTGICHCKECQRQTGTAWSVVVVIDENALHVSGDSLAEFETTSDETQTPVARRFCSNCGSPIVSLPASMPGLAAIKAGTLEDMSWLQPEAEVWCESAQPWVGHDEQRGQFPRGLPAG